MNSKRQKVLAKTRKIKDGWKILVVLAVAILAVLLTNIRGLNQVGERVEYLMVHQQIRKDEREQKAKGRAEGKNLSKYLRQKSR